MIENEAIMIASLKGAEYLALFNILSGIFLVGFAIGGWVMHLLWQKAHKKATDEMTEYSITRIEAMYRAGFAKGFMGFLDKAFNEGDQECKSSDKETNSSPSSSRSQNSTK